MREIKNSISQKPKNVSYLTELYEKEGEKAVEKIAEKKRDEILKIFAAMYLFNIFFILIFLIIKKLAMI